MAIGRNITARNKGNIVARQYSSGNAEIVGSGISHYRGELGKGTPGKRLKNWWAGSETADSENLSLRAFVRGVVSGKEIDGRVYDSKTREYQDAKVWMAGK